MIFGQDGLEEEVGGHSPEAGCLKIYKTYSGKWKI
jgi:hypothetical protein